MALVTRPDGQKIKVKNLGWLLGHAPFVAVIRCTRFTTAERAEHGGADAKLTAWLSDGTIFESNFADHAVLAQWVKRRSLRNAKIETYYAGTLTEEN